MKKKRLIRLIMSIVAVALLVGGGIWFYETKTTVAKTFNNKILETEQTKVDNHLSNNFYLRFSKNHAYLMAIDSYNEGYKKSKLSQQLLKAYGKDRKDMLDAGEIDLGRVKSKKIKNGYRITTKKVTFIFKKTDVGDYRTQDGTRWVFSVNQPKSK